MANAVLWVSVLLLGWTWTLQGLPDADDGLNMVNGTVEASEEEIDDRPFNATVACNLPPKVGPCKALKKRYFYNSTSAACEVFIYGGCIANQNNFRTEAACLQSCPAPEED